MSEQNQTDAPEAGDAPEAETEAPEATTVSDASDARPADNPVETGLGAGDPAADDDSGEDSEKSGDDTPDPEAADAIPGVEGEPAAELTAQNLPCRGITYDEEKGCLCATFRGPDGDVVVEERAPAEIVTRISRKIRLRLANKAIEQITGK